MAIENDPRFQQLKARFQRFTANDEINAFLGDGNGAIKVPQKSNYVYVRIDQGNSLSAPTEARNDANVEPFDGAGVVVATVGGELAVKRAEANVQLSQGGTFISSVNTNPLDPDTRAVLFDDTFNKQLRISTSATSQAVTVASDISINSQTVYTYDGETLNLSANYPAASKRCMAVVFLAADNTLEVTTSTDAELLDPPSETELQECLDAASVGARALYSINLVNGDNTIKGISSDNSSSRIWQDLRHSIPIAHYPTRCTIWHDEATIIAGNALAQTIDTAHGYAVYYYQNAPALNDEFDYDIFLSAGTYTLSVFGLTSANSGIVTWYLDDVSQGTQDWYSASLTRNVTKTTSITVVGDGRHVLRGKMESKNASSGNYFMTLTKLWVT